jgi:ribose 5-phosphate isomerase A
MAEDSESSEADSKRRAAAYAATLIEDRMVVGLGSGSTARLFVDALIERVHGGLGILGVATSEATAAQAAAGGIRLVSLEDHPRLDITVDGADEVDPRLNLIKGLGGALLREKIVASSTDRLVIIVDKHKLVPRLGDHTPVPVEVVTFGWTRVDAELRSLGARPERRMAGSQPFLTDGGHYILDCWFDRSVDLLSLASPIKALTGVVEQGLFLGMAYQVVVGTANAVDVIDRSGRRSNPN